MKELTKFRRREQTPVVAVQVKLETGGFNYSKWGAEQTCKPGDWLVDNGGDVYTVDRETFARTYEAVSPGVFRKTAPVWARVAETPGSIGTKEGETHYDSGDYIVFNNPDGTDGYAVSQAKFEELYEADK